MERALLWNSLYMIDRSGFFLINLILDLLFWIFYSLLWWMKCMTLLLVERCMRCVSEVFFFYCVLKFRHHGILHDISTISSVMLFLLPFQYTSWYFSAALIMLQENKRHGTLSFSSLHPAFLPFSFLPSFLPSYLPPFLPVPIQQSFSWSAHQYGWSVNG